MKLLKSLALTTFMAVSVAAALWATSGIAIGDPIDSYFTLCEPIQNRHQGAALSAYRGKGYQYACDNQKFNRVAELIAKYGVIYNGKGCEYDSNAGEYHCAGSQKLTTAPAHDDSFDAGMDQFNNTMKQLPGQVKPNTGKR